MEKVFFNKIALSSRLVFHANGWVEGWLINMELGGGVVNKPGTGHWGE